MREQHLSDEAIAAFADDVLANGARERARRHTATCAECNHAVAVQREAVWALRSAPAPALPIGLLDRLRDVPVTTPIQRVPAVFDERGTAMFATLAAPAALVPRDTVRIPQSCDQTAAKPRSRRARPGGMTAASVAFLGALAALTVAADSGPASAPSAVQPANVRGPSFTVYRVPERLPGQVPAAVDFLRASSPAR